jgi:hypothetical protein
MLLPTPALACGIGDVGCEGDGITYLMWLGLAKALWFLNRLMLQGAYLLDILRREVITVMDTPIEVLTSFANTTVVAVAGLALTIALLILLVVPLTGMESPFNVRQILILTVAAPIVLSGLGAWMVDLDTLRVDLSQYIYSVAARVNVGSGVISTMGTSGEMGAATGEDAYLYPATGQCGQMLLPRFSGGLEEARVLRPDEAAAAFFYANAVDLHCPQLGQGPEKDLPQGFYNQPTPGYAYSGDIRNQSDASQRGILIAGVQAGVVRLLAGLLVSFLVLLYYIAQLVFTLAIIALFVGLVFGMLFGFFRRDFSWAGQFFSRAATVLQVSWVSSFILGVLFAALVATAQTGNAGIFAGLAIGQIAFTLQIALTAFQSLRGAIDAIATVVGGIMGGASTLTQAAGMTSNLVRGATGGAASLAMGAATGGASLAGAATLGTARSMGAAGVTAAIAANQTGSGTYALSAAMGRFAPVAKLGEVASGMGVLPDEIADGLRAGRMATGSSGVDGLSRRARADRAKYMPVADQRQLRGQIDQARMDAANDTTGTPQAFGFQAGNTQRGTFSRLVRQNALPTDSVPKHATTERLDNDQVQDLLKKGNRVQFNKDGTITHWNPKAPPPVPPAPPAPALPAPKTRRMAGRIGRMRPSSQVGQSPAEETATTIPAEQSAVPPTLRFRSSRIRRSDRGTERDLVSGAAPAATAEDASPAPTTMPVEASRDRPAGARPTLRVAAQPRAAARTDRRAPTASTESPQPGAVPAQGRDAVSPAHASHTAGVTRTGIDDDRSPRTSSAGSPRTGATVPLDRSQRAGATMPVRADARPASAADRPLRRAYVARTPSTDVQPNTPPARRPALRPVRRRPNRSTTNANDDTWLD